MSLKKRVIKIMFVITGKRIVLVTEFNIDYIIPLSKGGENCLANSQALCNSCCEKKIV